MIENIRLYKPQENKRLWGRKKPRRMNKCKQTSQKRKIGAELRNFTGLKDQI